VINESWLVGLSKKEITPNLEDIGLNKVGMLGYGMPEQKMQEILNPLFSRVAWIELGENVLIWVHVELCFPADSLRQEILKRINEQNDLPNINHHQLVIASQHTHSGPAGYCHYPFYNIPTPGFVPQVFEKNVSGIMEAIREASLLKRPSSLKFSKEEFGAEAPVAFNRSTAAWRENFEVKNKSLSTDPVFAMDRHLYGIKIKAENQVIGLMNWFGVHCTNFPNTNLKVTSDNKGFAASFVEEQLAARDVSHVALFNQGAAADITPNFIWDDERNEIRGQFQNNLESARFNGKLQATVALNLIDKSSEDFTIEPQLWSQTLYVDMDGVKVDPQFIPPHIPAPKDAMSVSPAFGTSFMAGTEEGRGAPPVLCFLVSLLSSLVKLVDVIRSFWLSSNEREKLWRFYRHQAPKNIFVETGHKKILGISDLSYLPIPRLVDPLIGIIKDFYKKGSMREHTWTQQVVPVQLVILGKVALVNLPGEVTSMSGLRLKEQVKNDLNLHEVIISAYTNGAAGYITTPEEYQCNHYEAGHTPFGKWTLPAYQTIVRSLCWQYLKKENYEYEVKASAPVIFSEEDIKRRTIINS
jgi:neutral ceramidase